MSKVIPITLQGDNLGRRHLYLNNIVKQAIEENIKFETVKDLPETSPVDRLFKIELASKLKNVDFIIENLKNNDMLYVSKALKSIWILDAEYENVINPNNLETNLYPNMITTAVSKMKQWLYLNLKDEKRNESFYEFYCEKNFDYAIKFLFKSSKTYIEECFPKVMSKINPHQFKILCEISSKVAKLFFDEIPRSETIKTMYLKNEKKYFSCITYILKSDSNLYLDIYEKYFNSNDFAKISPSGTKYIMTNCKERFNKKPELYTAWLLNMNTLSQCLTIEESKELVLKLAKAKYLRHWFDYKAVEPLIKRLKKEDRAAFKKKVFVDRDIGDEINDWSYETPSSPELEKLGVNVFEDQVHYPNEYLSLDKTFRCGKRLIKKRSARWAEDDCYCCEMACEEKVKTLLDKLFDEFRFSSFQKTLYELRKRIPVESTPQNREYMMLVLVSKTGGRLDALEDLLELLANHSNEPVHIRAAVVRSLVKRAFVWRLPEDTWQKLFKFARGLGLDGKTPEADCNEGLHCVVIRNLITNKFDTEINKAYLEKFSNFTEYKLSASEKTQIKETLPKMLIEAAIKATSASESLNFLEKLIDTLEAYKINVASYPGLIPTIIDWAEKDYKTFKSLLLRLYRSRIGRKDLFKLTFGLLNTDASYVNALKHDTSIVDIKNLIKLYNTKTKKINKRTFKRIHEKFRTNQFLKKLSLYFNEDNGLGKKLLEEIKTVEANRGLGHPLAVLLGSEIITHLETLSKSEDNKEIKLLSSSIKSNAHLARPVIDINTINWVKVGPKFVVNKTIISPHVTVADTVQKLLNWKPTMKAAFKLSERINKEIEVLEFISKTKPSVAFKLGQKLIQKKNETVDQVWKIIKPLIEDLDLVANDKKFIVKLLHVNSVPEKFQPELCYLLYKKNKTVSYYKAMSFLCHMENTIQAIDGSIFETILLEFLETFVPEKLKDKKDEKVCNCLNIRVLIKHILLSKTIAEQNRKLDVFGQPFLDKLALLFPDKKELFFEYFDEVALNLKFINVYINPDYVSCLPVIEKVVNMMQRTLPMEKYFSKFVEIHLTMLYFKALRHCVVQKPDIFSDEKRKIKEGTIIFGYIFGKLIAEEVNELIDKYFETVIDLYLPSLLEYLNKYFNYTDSSEFLIALIRGLLENSVGAEIRIGINVLKQKSYNLENHSNELKNYIKNKNNDYTNFFGYAELFACMLIN